MCEIKQPKDYNGFFGIKWDENFAGEKNMHFKKTQRFIDSECIRHMKPYMPFRNGILEASATIGTVIGSGEIHQNLSYAHYQYVGKVYGPNIPIMENGILVGFYSKPNEKKHPTGANIVYNKSKHPLAGPFWFARMVADKKQIILRGAAKISGGVVK